MPSSVQCLIISYNFVPKMDLSKKFRVGESKGQDAGYCRLFWLHWRMTRLLTSGPCPMPHRNMQWCVTKPTSSKMVRWVGPPTAPAPCR